MKKLITFTLILTLIFVPTIAFAHQAIGALNPVGDGASNIVNAKIIDTQNFPAGTSDFNEQKTLDSMPNGGVISYYEDGSITVEKFAPDPFDLTAAMSEMDEDWFNLVCDIMEEDQVYALIDAIPDDKFDAAYDGAWTYIIKHDIRNPVNIRKAFIKYFTIK